MTKGRLKHHTQIDGFGVGECFVCRQNIGIVYNTVGFQFACFSSKLRIIYYTVGLASQRDVFKKQSNQLEQEEEEEKEKMEGEEEETEQEQDDDGEKERGGRRRRQKNPPYTFLHPNTRSPAPGGFYW